VVKEERTTQKEGRKERLIKNEKRIRNEKVLEDVNKDIFNTKMR
jgi:hypothetical protein